MLSRWISTEVVWLEYLVMDDVSFDNDCRPSPLCVPVDMVDVVVGYSEGVFRFKKGFVDVCYVNVMRVEEVDEFRFFVKDAIGA